MPLRTWLIDPKAAWSWTLPGLSLASAVRRYSFFAILSAVVFSLNSLANSTLPSADLAFSIGLLALTFFAVVGFAVWLAGKIIHSPQYSAGENGAAKGTAVLFHIAGPLCLLGSIVAVFPLFLVHDEAQRFLVGIAVDIALAATVSFGFVVAYEGLSLVYSASGLRFFIRVVVGLICSTLLVLFFLFVPFFLLNVLCCGPPSDPIMPEEIMKAELKSIVTSGFGTSSPKQVEFRKDEYIDIKSVVGDAPIVENDVQFICGAQSTELCSGGGSPLLIDNAKGTGSITVNKNFKAYVVVCGDDTKQKYCISVARQGSDARRTCTETCLS